MSVGSRIREARKKAGLTQGQLAELIGTTGGAIGNYENGTSHPKEPFLLKLIEVLPVDANFLFQDSIKEKTAHEGRPLDELEQKIMDGVSTLPTDDAAKVLEYVRLLILKQSQ